MITNAADALAVHQAALAAVPTGINIILADVEGAAKDPYAVQQRIYRLTAAEVTQLTGLGFTITTDANGMSCITWGA
jgi:hypothetical protein